LTVSIALRMATRTSLTPSAWARSIAFWTMSTLTSSVGAMLTAASVMISASSWSGTSMMKQWLIRRAVRRPVSRGHRAHQLVGVQAAFHQRFGAALAHQRDRLRRRVLAVLRVDDFDAVDVDAPSAATVADPASGPTRIGSISFTKGPVMTLIDEFYKVGPGPSSSHTIGPMRITYDFYQRAPSCRPTSSRRRRRSRCTCSAASAPPARATAPSAPRWPA
jgi:hypothetical protein